MQDQPAAVLILAKKSAAHADGEEMPDFSGPSYLEAKKGMLQEPAPCPAGGHEEPHSESMSVEDLQTMLEEKLAHMLPPGATAEVTIKMNGDNSDEEEGGDEGEDDEDNPGGLGLTYE